MTDFVDFELEIERVGERYRARVLRPPEGRGKRTLFDLPREDPQGFANGASRSGTGLRHMSLDEPMEDFSEDFGRQLFQAVFTGPVRDAWIASLAKAGLRVRLLLRLGDDPLLLDLPWELLQDPDQDSAVAIRLPVVRALDAPVASLPFGGDEKPMRILAVLSCPDDRAHLDMEAEWRALDQVLGPLVAHGEVALEKIEQPTIHQLNETLRGSTWHVLHFIGHGEVGALILGDPDGRSRSVDHQRLGLFIPRTSLRLVVLNACEGARPGHGGVTGVAQALLKNGIPAVIAMRKDVSDKAAIRFTKRFYEALTSHLPVDVALLEARKALFGAEDPEWAVPVLYLGTPENPPAPVIERHPEPVKHDIWKGLAAFAAVLLLLGMASWLWPRKPDQISRLLPPLPPRGSEENPKECPSPEGLNIAFAKIPRGIFYMGRKRGDRAEKPTHRVSITEPYCLGIYEVTRGQWNHVLGLPAPQETERYLPVRGITYEEAEHFLETLNAMDSRSLYRLPTEAEWEYAARAESQTRYSFGDDVQGLVLHGNCKGNKDGFAEVAPVGQLKPNGFGLHDMYGNVFEWVFDWYDSYSDKNAVDPKGPDQGKKRIRRGGSWESRAKVCSSTARSDVLPERSNNDTGLRILREIR